MISALADRLSLCPYLEGITAGEAEGRAPRLLPKGGEAMFRTDGTPFIRLKFALEVFENAFEISAWLMENLPGIRRAGAPELVSMETGDRYIINAETDMEVENGQD